MGKSVGMMNEALPPMPSAANALIPDAGGWEAGDFGEGAVDREDVLARYRRLRAINRDHNDEIMNRVSTKAVLGWGKRLGLARGKTFFTDGFEELSLVFDLAVYSARLGKTPAVERYRRAADFPAGSDEAIMLNAMCDSRFSLFVVNRRHAAAGLVLDDVFRQQEIWLMDEGFEVSAPEDTAFVSRVVKPDLFHMTTGTAIPVDASFMEEVVADFSFRNGDAFLTESRDEKFIEAVYRGAVEWGLMETIQVQ